MILNLYECIKEKDLAKLKSIISKDLLLSEITGAEDTALHVAVQYETKGIVEELCNICPQLLLRQNAKGDTPLHIAARHGLTDIVAVLLSCAGTRLSDEESGTGDVLPKHYLVRMGNKEMDTALHEAVRNGYIWVAELLFDAGPEFEYFANKSQKTPLYLAVEQGYLDMVKRLLENRSCSAPGGPDGTIALHAAVISTGDLEFPPVKKLPSLIEELIETDWSDQSDYSIISSLLAFDRNMGYVASNDGSTALHVAVSKGDVEAMKKILLVCPDSWGMLNSRGQNILHIAAEFKMGHMVKLIFQSSVMVKVLVNELDCDGNTPFHLAAHTYTKTSKFEKNVMVNKTIKNKENLTALNILRKTKKLHDSVRHLKDDPWSDKEVIHWKDHSQISLVVAALIATVTFTAGLTLPGGFIQQGKNRGKSILLADTDFKLFVILNTITLVLSVLGMSIYYIVMVIPVNKSRTILLYKCGLVAVYFALTLLPWTFVQGCRIVLVIHKRNPNKLERGVLDGWLVGETEDLCKLINRLFVISVYTLTGLIFICSTPFGDYARSTISWWTWASRFNKISRRKTMGS